MGAWGRGDFPESLAPLLQGRGRGRAGVADASSGFLGLRAPPLPAEGLVSHASLQLKAWDCGPNCRCCLIPCGRGYGCGWKARVICIAFPDATRFSGARGLSSLGHPSGITGTISTVPLVPPPLCVPVNPPLDVWMCGILQCSGMSGRDTFVELWIFYWL